VDKVRYALARDYLSSSEFSMMEIAFVLGVSAGSTFRRAFRSWSGVSPRDFRQRFVRL
jgi:transcriptional regulator GlxA family with amidase domain